MDLGVGSIVIPFIFSWVDWLVGFITFCPLLLVSVYVLLLYLQFIILYFFPLKFVREFLYLFLISKH